MNLLNFSNLLGNTDTTTSLINFVHLYKKFDLSTYFVVAVKLHNCHALFLSIELSQLKSLKAL